MSNESGKVKRRRNDPTRMFVHKKGCAELPWRVSEYKGEDPYNAHIMPAEGHLPVANIVGIRVGARESAAYIVEACNGYAALTQQLAQLQAQNTALLAREKLLEQDAKRYRHIRSYELGLCLKSEVLYGTHLDAALDDEIAMLALLRPSGGEGEK